MLHGPWKEANAPIVTLHIDDNNVNGEAIAMALAYLYGHHPKLNDNNAFRVLAAASFLDLQVNVFLVGSYDGRCSFLSYSKLLCSSMNIFFPFLWHYFFYVHFGLHRVLRPCRIYVQYARISLYLSCGPQTSYPTRFEMPVQPLFIVPA